MSYRAIVCERALTPAPVYGPTTVLLHGQRIEAVGPKDEVSIPRGAERIEYSGCSAAPGLIDLHTHGLLGFDVMGDGLAGAIAAYPSQGVTSFLATTISRPPDAIQQALRAMDQVLGTPPAGADCLGVHLEGPYLAADYAGMADPELTHDFDFDEFERFQAASGRRILCLTAAPERFPDLNAIQQLSDAGVRVSVGHTGANYQLTSRALGAGAQRASHLFNAMSGFGQRSPGAAIALLLHDGSFAEIIADGAHIAPPVLELAWRLKGPSQLLLVSDSAPVSGLPDGSYAWADLPIRVKERRCQRSDGTLAGSWFGLDRSIQTMVKECRVPVDQAVRMATQTPAESLGLTDRGRLAPGLRADLCLLDDELKPVHTIVAGETVWRNDHP